VTDALPNDLDPGIRHTVAFLNANGFTTSDSGDGVSKPAAGDDEALNMAHVYISVDHPSNMITEARRLRDLLASVGVNIGPQGPDGAAIQATYDPGDDSAIIALYGVDDAALVGGGASLVFEAMAVENREE
jgi:hypothetical protein